MATCFGGKYFYFRERGKHFDAFDVCFLPRTFFICLPVYQFFKSKSLKVFYLFFFVFFKKISVLSSVFLLVFCNLCFAFNETAPNWIVNGVLNGFESFVLLETGCKKVTQGPVFPNKQH